MHIAFVVNSENVGLGVLIKESPVDEANESTSFAVVAYTPSEWRAFLGGVRNSEFDLEPQSDLDLLLEETVSIADRLDEDESLRTPVMAAILEELMNRVYDHDVPDWEEVASFKKAEITTHNDIRIGVLVKTPRAEGPGFIIHALTEEEWNEYKDKLMRDAYALDRPSNEPPPGQFKLVAME